MKAFSLKIRTPEKKLFEGAIVNLKVVAVDGRLEVLADHAPLVSRLVRGKVSCQLPAGEKVELDCGEGFLLVAANRAEILLS